MSLLPLAAEENPIVTAGAATYPARTILGAAALTVSAPLIYGKLGTDSDVVAWAGKVVLFDRGTLSFFEKVSKAKTASALAVIISNNITGPVVVFQFGADAHSLIPAVSVTQADGLELRAKVGTTVQVGAAVPPPGEVEIPDPTGLAGKWMKSDGTKYVLETLPASVPGVSIIFEGQLGQQISLGVSSSGSGPWTYQWHKNGVVIPGATSAVLDIPVTKASDAGSYVCQVANAQGTAPSGAGVITLKP